MVVMIETVVEEGTVLKHLSMLCMSYCFFNDIISYQQIKISIKIKVTP